MQSRKPIGNIKSRSVPMPASTGEVYKPQWIPVRPGAQDHERVPSRRSDGRYYRDGSVGDAS